MRQSKNPKKCAEPRRYATRTTVRHAVAVEAARLLYHREYKEYFQAKREAAKRSGTTVLPTNSEIHQQLLLLADRTEGAARTQRLGAMRRLAFQLMELLSEFEPRLIGSTWTGHIRKGSDVDLNLFEDELEAVLQTLEQANLVFDVERVRSRQNGQEREFIHVHLQHPSELPVEITVYPKVDLKTHPKCSITGGPMARATRAEVEMLISKEHPDIDPVSFASEKKTGEELVKALEHPLNTDKLCKILPEFLALRGVQQNHYHHLDVYDHTVVVVEALQRHRSENYEFLGDMAVKTIEHFEQPGRAGWSRFELLKFAGLCHDFGKPKTWTLHHSGRIRFLGHESEGAGLVRLMSLRLGLHPSISEALSRIVGLHMEPMLIPGDIHSPPSRIYRLFCEMGDLMPELLLLSLADVEAARGPAQSESRLIEQRYFVQELMEEYFEHGFLRFPNNPVTSVDLELELGITDSVLRRRLVAVLTEAYVDGEFEGREDGLMFAAELLETPHEVW